MGTQQTKGVGPTAELSLRVSVATLVRVVLPSPADGEAMLALEHKATTFAREGAQLLVVKAQPFGGAIRFLRSDRFQTQISRFHYDSERARAERDFRIFIRPMDWERVRDFCLRNLYPDESADLETNPIRELVEEFEDTLGIPLAPDQYTLKPLRTLLENEPARTQNVRAFGNPTVRVYRIFEAKVSDPALCRAMVANASQHPSQVLADLAKETVQRGDSGRVNAMWVAPLHQVYAAYQALPSEQRSTPISFEKTLLDGNVPAVLDGLDVPKFQIVDHG